MTPIELDDEGFHASEINEEEHPRENRLLARFPEAEREQLRNRGERLRVPAGEMICDPGQPARYVDFPITGILSSTVTLANGSVVEAAMIGNEGLAGLPALFNFHDTPVRVVQRLEGDALRVALPDVQEILANSPAVRGIVGRYVMSLFQQCAQNVACNLHHRLDQRMCRWLAATADRADRAEFRVTQEFLGEMLGVSRQSINAAASGLQEKGLIAYRRGRVTIVDRPRLEEAACECRESSRAAYQRLMGGAT